MEKIRDSTEVGENLGKCVSDATEGCPVQAISVEK
jgi:ferredoxin